MRVDARAAEETLVQGDLVIEARRDMVDDLAALGHDLGADAVSGRYHDAPAAQGPMPPFPS